MKTLSRALFSAGVWAVLQAMGVAQLELKPVGPKKDAVIPLAPAPVQAGGIIIAPQGGRGAEVIIGNRVIINGGNAVVIGGLTGDGNSEPAKVEPDPAGAQVLDYAGGQRLHGTLDSLDSARGEMIWRRPDASVPLAIPLAQINRWSSDNQGPTEVRPMATVKFSGSDWLVADVTSIQGDDVELQLLDGTRIKTTRAHIEWIYFSQSGAAETYDGPTSFAGWSSAGTWTYRDGALRATSPSPVIRMFRSLPDQVEYRMVVDQGELANAFTLALHARNAATRGLNRGMLQISLRASSLNLWGLIEGNFKSLQVDLGKVLANPGERPKGPMLFRVFEDFTSGRVLVFLNGRKAAEWTVDKGEAGTNGGAFSFQPTSWSGEAEQSLSMIRVLPWDGREPAEDDDRSRDRVSVREGDVKSGKLTSWDGKVLKLSTEQGVVTVPAEQLGMVRFQRPENPPEDQAPMARVRLAGRGEFEAVALDWRDGKFQIRTNFGGEIALPPVAIAEIGFDRVGAKTATTDDLLVFQNGDRLRGAVEAASNGGKLRWQTAKGAPVVEFATANIAGVQFAPRVPGAPRGAVARFRNGDWLGGGFVTIDREQLVLDTAEAGQITAPRSAVKALYLSPEGAPAVSAGLGDHAIWERGFDLNNSSTVRKKLAEAGSAWSYFAGTFSRARAAGDDFGYSRAGGMQLGRVFDTLPARVEVNMTISAERTPVFFSAQLFTEAGNPGYMLHLSSVGISLYDMNPRPRGRGVAQQQFQFGKETAPNARERQLRFLADRTSGRMTIIVDGVIVGQVNPKVADGPRDLGRGVLIMPQSTQGFTVSNLWIGPWNGVVPGKTPGADGAQIVALVNGDEVQGAVEMATPTTLKVASDVGPLDLPMERVTMVDFGGPPIERCAETRLNLAGQGTITVSSWRIENDAVICRSEIIGELRLPLTSIQEIVLAAPQPAKPAN